MFFVGFCKGAMGFKWLLNNYESSFGFYSNIQVDKIQHKVNYYKTKQMKSQQNELQTLNIGIKHP